MDIRRGKFVRVEKNNNKVVVEQESEKIVRLSINNKEVIVESAALEVLQAAIQAMTAGPVKVTDPKSTVKVDVEKSKPKLLLGQEKRVNRKRGLLPDIKKHLKSRDFKAQELVNLLSPEQPNRVYKALNYLKTKKIVQKTGDVWRLV